MKKILTHLTGIVFFISILVAGACISACNNSKPQAGPKKVKIYVQAHEIKGKMHLKMYDSNDTTIVVVDTLHTDVMPGTKVIWMWLPESEIQEFVKISPKKADKIITGNAEKIPFTKKLRLKIPKNAPIPSVKEKYDIIFIDKLGDTITIDPYLKIPKRKLE